MSTGKETAPMLRCWLSPRSLHSTRFIWAASSPRPSWLWDSSVRRRSFRSFDRHSFAHCFAACQILGSGSKHSSERSRKMRGIGEPRDMRGFGDSYSIHELIGCPLETEPKDIRTYRNSDRRCEDVYKPRWRKTRYSAKVLSETSAPLPRFSRRYLRTRLTRG